jgi:hypothetical protein
MMWIADGTYKTRVTLPERMQLVQTLIRFGVPPSLILTVWIFTFHFLLVWRFEWETLFPDACPFPHIAHFLDISHLLAFAPIVQTLPVTSRTGGDVAVYTQSGFFLSSKHAKNMIP